MEKVYNYTRTYLSELLDLIQMLEKRPDATQDAFLKTLKREYAVIGVMNIHNFKRKPASRYKEQHPFLETRLKLHNENNTNEKPDQ